jgi:uncharacterized protein YdhG (YjbR/CyaY superfamily)
MPWKMPTYRQGKNLIHFAAHKNHLGITFGVDTIEAFADRIVEAGYKVSKGNVQIPWSKTVSYDLIAEMTQYCVMTEGLSCE